MTREFSTDRPIFLQIVEILTEDIVSGKRAEGDKMPPVREYALLVGVNPNTVQRAYNELERVGLIKTRRGDGSYITRDKEVICNLSTSSLDRAVDDFLQKVMAMGFDEDTVMQTLAVRLKKRNGDNDGKTTDM